MLPRSFPTKVAHRLRTGAGQAPSRIRAALPGRLSGPFPGWRPIARDALAGVVSALVTIAYCISFSALIFQGAVQAGLGLGLAALLTGSAVTGLLISLTTTLPPADAGPDTPAIAVLSVLAATVSASVLAAGGTSDDAVRHVLLAITLATLATGLVLFLIGGLRLGQLLRFVPYPVIGGFLAASGVLLITGAVEVMSGLSLGDGSLSKLLSDPSALARLVIGFAFAGGVLMIRRRMPGPFLLPVAFFLCSLVMSLFLWRFAGEDGSAWYVAGNTAFKLWWPVGVALEGDVDWTVFLAAFAEIGAVCGVTAIALLLDISSLEVARARGADVDQEFRLNGYANGIAGMLGGVAGNLSLQASMLIEEAGGRTRLSGVFAACTIGLVLLLGVDLTRLVPTPVLGGLLAYLGILIVIQAIIRSPARRTTTDLVLATVIMAVIVWFGYLVGVMIGLVAACLLFAINYSRIGVVRRHLTRAEFSSNVDRSIAEANVLRESGRSIHLFWLAGFIFFGSSNGLYEEIKRQIGDGGSGEPVRFIILDFAGVSGFDTSAVLSLVKLRNHCDQSGIILILSGLQDDTLRLLELSGFAGDLTNHRIFRTRSDALEWAEDQLIGQSVPENADHGDFETWLMREICGTSDNPELPASRAILSFLEQREFEEGSLLYNEGDEPDTIDIVASGRLAVTITNSEGRAIRIRVMSGRTVVGEMGFFRRSPRVASIFADKQTVVYTMRREAFERLQREHPALAAGFMRFIIRTLADRLAFANQEVAALA